MSDKLKCVDARVYAHVVQKVQKEVAKLETQFQGQNVMVDPAVFFAKVSAAFPEIDKNDIKLLLNNQAFLRLSLECQEIYQELLGEQGIEMDKLDVFLRMDMWENYKTFILIQDIQEKASGAKPPSIPSSSSVTPVTPVSSQSKESSGSQESSESPGDTVKVETVEDYTIPNEPEKVRDELRLPFRDGNHFITKAKDKKPGDVIKVIVFEVPKGKEKEELEVEMPKPYKGFTSKPTRHSVDGKDTGCKRIHGISYPWGLPFDRKARASLGENYDIKNVQNDYQRANSLIKTYKEKLNVDASFEPQQEELIEWWKSWAWEQANNQQRRPSPKSARALVPATPSGSIVISRKNTAEEAYQQKRSKIKEMEEHAQMATGDAKSIKERMRAISVELTFLKKKDLDDETLEQISELEDEAKDLREQLLECEKSEATAKSELRKRKIQQTQLDKDARRENKRAALENIPASSGQQDGSEIFEALKNVTTGTVTQTTWLLGIKKNPDVAAFLGLQQGIKDREDKDDPGAKARDAAVKMFKDIAGSSPTARSFDKKQFLQWCSKRDTC
jgi:hypothetical protein